MKYRKRVYVQLAEKALGHPLPPGAVVHHIDEDRRNNVSSNLVILQTTGEHSRLHRRLRIQQADGNPWTQQICCTCRQVKDLVEFPPKKRAQSSECLPCSATRNLHRYHKKRGQPLRHVTREEWAARARACAYRRWYGDAGGAPRP